MTSQNYLTRGSIIKREKTIRTLIISLLATTAIVTIMATAVIFSHQVLAQVPTSQVTGFGDSLERFTCANGQRPFGGSLINEVITFQAAQPRGQPATGQFSIQGVDANGASKQGTINNIQISNGMFVLTGTETSNTLCTAGGDIIPSNVQITGECKIQDQLPVAEINFVAQNGERGTFTGGVSCFLPLTLMFQNQGQCIDFANHNPGNTLGVTKQTCMVAFQNKYTTMP
jgi:hypothetical protein